MFDLQFQKDMNGVTRDQSTISKQEKNSIAKLFFGDYGRFSRLESCECSEAYTVSTAKMADLRIFRPRLLGLLIVLTFQSCTSRILALQCGNPVSAILRAYKNHDWDSHPSTVVVQESGTTTRGSEGGLDSSMRLTMDMIPKDLGQSTMILTVGAGSQGNQSWADALRKVYNVNRSMGIREVPLLIVVPRRAEDAPGLLSMVSELEEPLRRARAVLPRTFIVWTKVCSGGSLLMAECYCDTTAHGLDETNGTEAIGSHRQSELPTVASEIYLAVCDGNGAATGSTADNTSSNSTDGHDYKLVSIHRIGRANTIVVKLRDWVNIFNHYHYIQTLEGGVLHMAFRKPIAKQELSYEPNNATRNVKLTGGFIGNVFQYLKEGLNFTPIFDIAQTWQGPFGIVDMTQHDIIDAVAEKVTYIPSRTSDFQTLIPIYKEGIYLFFRQPPASSIRNIFTQPFQVSLWAVLLVVWIVVAFSSILAAKIKSTFQQLHERDEKISKESILWAIGCTCQQGWYIDPEAISIKIIFLCGSLLGLIVYVAYSAALVSTLSAVVVPIKTFSDFLTNNLLGVTYDPSNSAINFVLEDPEVRKHFSKREYRVPETQVGVKVVFDTQTGMLISPDLFYSIAANMLNVDDGDLCTKITAMKVNQVPMKSGLLLPKWSPYTELLKTRIMTMLENGVLARLLRRYYLTFKGDCNIATRSLVNDDVSLGFTDVFTAFAIMLFGYALSFCILIVEKLHAIMYLKKFHFIVPASNHKLN